MQSRAMRRYAARRGWTIALQVREVNSGGGKARSARETAGGGPGRTLTAGHQAQQVHKLYSSGNFQVYVRAFPDNGGKWQMRTYPVWFRSGRELFFESLDNWIMWRASWCGAILWPRTSLGRGPRGRSRVCQC